MDTNHIADGLIQYLMLVALLTFHEFGHAWTAWKCGDDTARLQGRVSLNPVVHIDPIGTVFLPLLMIFMPSGISQFMIGWAKPVPVNLSNLNNRNRDDILITMAGPGMNFVLAILLVILAKVGSLFNLDDMTAYCWIAAYLSLMLCYFNLIPIPPLDGSWLMRKATGMKYETHQQISQYGFIIIIIFLQIPGVRQTLHNTTLATLQLMGRMVWL
jgi:Zn-dependent protease